MEIRPDYYLDPRGHDRFYGYEHGYIPATLAIGFVHESYEKYLCRAGLKTVDMTTDLDKAATYVHEFRKLMELRQAGIIHDDVLERFLDATYLDQKVQRMLERIERVRRGEIINGNLRGRSLWEKRS